MEKGDHLREWLAMVKEILSEDPYIITDNYNTDAQKLNSSFIDNRHDQSLFSVSRKLIGSVVIDENETDPPNRKYPFWASRLRE
jgi:hypothetical protein